MLKTSTISLILILVIIACSCVENNPNIGVDGTDIIESHLAFTDESIQDYQDTVYIPIYSDIYNEHRLQSTLLTATLSIRSTSLTDTTYINTIDYYDTKGDKVRAYIDRTLVLQPLQSIEYVIDRDDTSGGSGANFIVEWGARRDTKPLFQAVMIGTTGQHGLSFVTDGISIKR